MVDIKSEAYKKGYKTGQTWQDNYRPGGPYAGSKPLTSNPDILAMHEQDVKNRADYLAGFDAAIAKRGYTIENGNIIK